MAKNKIRAYQSAKLPTHSERQNQNQEARREFHLYQKRLQKQKEARGALQARSQQANVLSPAQAQTVCAFLLVKALINAKLPLTFVLAVATPMMVAAASAPNFPEKGSYHDQRSYVESLTYPCEGILSEALTKARETGDPTHLDPQAVPEAVELDFWIHNQYPEQGVSVSRTVSINKGNSASGEPQKKDREEVYIKDKEGKGLLFKFFRDPNGRLVPTEKVAVDFAELTKGVPEDGSDAYVVRAEAEGESGTCFTYK